MDKQGGAWSCGLFITAKIRALGIRALICVK
jgi:hypothetical protein